jgi:hypothetical protein
MLLVAHRDEHRFGFIRRRIDHAAVRAPVDDAAFRATEESLERPIGRVV